MSSQKIPCTVAILTRNSSESLPRALQSVKNFSEIIVCDGYSTDETRVIAAQYGARIIDQDKRFLSSDGLIIDYSGVRNQTLVAASQPWFFFLDSDEYLSAALAREIRLAVASGIPAVYWVPRKYVYKGNIIDNSITYPNKQMRFFNAQLTSCFIKEVHERIEVLPSAEIKQFEEHLLVPIDCSVNDIKRKWSRYLEIESMRSPAITARRWARGALHELAVSGLYVARFIRNLFRRGSRLPARFELVRLWYQWKSITTSFSHVRSW